MQLIGKILVCTCPTAIGENLLPNGYTFHSVFKLDKKIITTKDLSMMKRILNSSVTMIIIDEVSMLPSNYLALLDERLKLIYDSLQNFGGISILLSGDFVQMPSLGGTDLYKVLYVRKNNVERKASSLFSNFEIFHMNKQVRAICEI